MNTPSALKGALPWLFLFAGPLAGLSWSRGYVLPRVMCAAFALTLVSMVAAGALAQRLFDGEEREQAATRPRAGIFQLLFIGQYALFFAALLISPFAALFSDLTGKHIPLRATLPAVVLLVCGWCLRRQKLAFRPKLPVFSALFAGLVGIALFRGLVLHSIHAGAIGHDTQSHIYWTEHIADYGFLPFASRDSDLLLTYPRHFHLLTASLHAMGLFGPVGPYVKIMPFLQTVLACGLFAELILAKLRSEHAEEPALAAIALGGFLCWHLTFGDGQELYRIGDLSGTARFSAGWILFALPLLVLAHQAKTLRDARGILIGAVPVMGALAFGINPSTLFFLIAYSLPVAAFLYFLGPARAGLPRISWQVPLISGGALALACVISNPFIASQLRTNALVSSLLHWLGIRTTSFGVVSSAWTDDGIGFAGLCAHGTLRCVRDIFWSALQDSFTSYESLLLRADLPGLDASHSAWYWLIFCTPLLISALFVALRGAVPSVSKDNARLFFAVAGASIFAGAPLLLFLTGLVQRLAVVGPRLSLLASYVTPHQLYLSSWLLCFVAVGSWLLVPSIRLPGWACGFLLLSTGLIVYSELDEFAPPDLVNHRHATRERAIDWPELRAIEHLNEFVPDGEAILIVALHSHVDNREHVMFVDSPEGTVLPHLETRVVFGLGLGAGADYGWADLEQRFCAANQAERGRFLRETNARWVLIRGMPRTRDAFNAFRWPCGVSLKDLSAEYPPAWKERDLSLYRINP